MQIDFDRSFIMADIPGLIEGAHEGVGLGHEFLRHIERAGILVHLVEPEPADGTEPLANYRSIRAELELHDAELGRRPEIVVVTKADLPSGRDVQQRLAESLNKDRAFAIGRPPPGRKAPGRHAGRGRRAGRDGPPP